MAETSLRTARGDAPPHFEYTLVFDEKIGAWPRLARTQYEYEETLHERDEAGDGEKASELVNQALSTFEELGMPKEVERALRRKIELQDVVSSEIKTSIGAVASAVQTEQPDLGPHAAPDGTVTILFSDIESHTAINERLGDQRSMELLREHNAPYGSSCRPTRLRSEDGRRRLHARLRQRPSVRRTDLHRFGPR